MEPTKILLPPKKKATLCISFHSDSGLRGKINSNVPLTDRPTCAEDKIIKICIKSLSGNHENNYFSAIGTNRVNNQNVLEAQKKEIFIICHDRKTLFNYKF